MKSKLQKTHFLFPLPDYYKVMEVLFSTKIFVIEFLSDLYFLNPKKWFFRKVYMFVCLWSEYSELYIPKTNKDRNIKFYT